MQLCRAINAFEIQQAIVADQAGAAAFHRHQGAKGNVAAVGLSGLEHHAADRRHRKLHPHPAVGLGHGDDFQGFDIGIDGQIPLFDTDPVFLVGAQVRQQHRAA